MIAPSKVYANALKLVDNLKILEMSKKVKFGKYAGKTVGELLTTDPQYVYWLIRETQFEVDPVLLGFNMPGAADIINAVKRVFSDVRTVEAADTGFTIVFMYHTEPMYDSWNVGHYGVREPELVRRGKTEYSTQSYTYEELLEGTLGRILADEFPFIPWTVEYVKNILKDHEEE